MPHHYGSDAVQQWQQQGRAERLDEQLQAHLLTLGRWPQRVPCTPGLLCAGHGPLPEPFTAQMSRRLAAARILAAPVDTDSPEPKLADLHGTHLNVWCTWYVPGTKYLHGIPACLGCCHLSS
jgi:hypothetical protein